MAAQVWKVSLTGISSSSNILSPAGFSNSRFTDDAQKQVKKKEDDNIINLKQKKAWDMVLDAAKNVPMNMFMMWMSGNSVQIFSIMITVMMFYNSVKGMMSVNSVFEKLAGGRVVLWPQKVVFLLVQCAFLGLGLWKMQGLGLLPTATSDWLSFLPLKEYSEVSAPGVFY